MELIRTLEHDEAKRLLSWAMEQPVGYVVNSRYAPGRKERWYGMSVKLTKPPLVTPCEYDQVIAALGAKLFPDWDCALLCKYEPGVGIAPHRDHSCFTAPAVLINLGEAVLTEGIARHPQLPKRTQLRHGDVIRLDTKITHGIEPVTKTRYSLTFRQIRGADLTGSFFDSLLTAP